MIASASPSPPAVVLEPLPSGSLLIVTTIAPTIRNFLLPYAAHFRSLGWRVEAAANGASDDEVVRGAFDDVHDVPLSRSSLDVGGMARSEREIGAVIRATRPDIVHVHTPIASFVTRLAVRRLPAAVRPAVAYTAHGFHFHAGGSPVTNAVFLTAERLAGRWTDRLVVINDEDAQAAARHHIVPRRRLVHMPGIGVDTARYSSSALEPEAVVRARESAGVPAGAPLFVVVAEHSPRKRVRDAIAALASMRHANAHLLLAGEGPERPRLERLVAELGVGNRVRFLGSVPDVRPVVSAATALILPSDREGLARCVMEAMSLEVPAIVSTARGNAELIGDDCGILVPIGDVDGLAAAMDRLVDHPDEAAEMGARGRIRMIERFDLARLLTLHDKLYRDLLEERAARSA